MAYQSCCPAAEMTAQGNRLLFWCLICSRRRSLSALSNAMGLQELAWLLTVIEKDKPRGLRTHFGAGRAPVSRALRFDQVDWGFTPAEWSDGTSRRQGKRRSAVQGREGRVDEIKGDHRGRVDRHWLRECRLDKGGNVWWKEKGVMGRRRGARARTGGAGDPVYQRDEG